MKRVVIGISLLLAFYASTSSAQSNYKYCELAGLAFGADHPIAGYVASRLAKKQGLMGTSECQAIWRDAYQTGRHFDKRSINSPEESASWDKLIEFEDKVIDAIITNMPAE